MILVPTYLETMQNIVTAAVIILEEVVRLLQRDSEVHQLAKDSHLGWNLLPYMLDEEETAYEERDSSHMIKSKEMVTAKKAFMAYHIDRTKTAS